MMHAWFGGVGGAPRAFQEDYHCYSVAYADKAHLEVGSCASHSEPTGETGMRPAYRGSFSSSAALPIIDESMNH